MRVPLALSPSPPLSRALFIYCAFNFSVRFAIFMSTFINMIGHSDCSFLAAVGQGHLTNN